MRSYLGAALVLMFSGHLATAQTLTMHSSMTPEKGPAMAHFADNNTPPVASPLERRTFSGWYQDAEMSLTFFKSRALGFVGVRQIEWTRHNNEIVGSLNGDLVHLTVTDAGIKGWVGAEECQLQLIAESAPDGQPVSQPAAPGPGETPGRSMTQQAQPTTVASE